MKRVKTTLNNLEFLTTIIKLTCFVNYMVVLKLMN